MVVCKYIDYIMNLFHKGILSLSFQNLDLLKNFSTSWLINVESGLNNEKVERKFGKWIVSFEKRIE
jgi:hypothetical protein